MKNGWIACCFFLVVFTNCNKSKNRVVDPELESHVSRFFEEASLRDIEVSDDNLEVVFRDLTDEGVCGLGYFKFEGTDLRKVEISPDFFCWGFHDEFARESLVFHELGHAILKRSHVSSNLPNGLPGRMMCDGNVCDIFSLYDQYTQGKRAYYLDKLFKPTTGTPDWGKIKRKATLFFEEKVDRDIPDGDIEVSDLKASTNFTHSIEINPTTTAKSIQLTAKDKIPNGATGSWVIRLDKPNIAEGLGLRLKANLTTENMEGEGVAIVLRTLSGQNEPFDISGATSSRNTTSIVGTTPETPYEVTLNYYPSKVQQIALIFQILPNTAGTVYIDDIQLDIMESE